MAADPRVEAVRQALGGHLGITDPPAGQCCAEVVVAALDAYDAPKFTSVVHECCERVEKAEAAIARVRALCDEADHSGRHVNGYGYVLLRPLRAALDGEA